MDLDRLTDPVVRGVVEAMVEGDRDAFLAAFAPGAELTDDGQPQSLAAWADREIFRFHGRLHVDREEGGGRHLTGTFHSDQWDMPTFWHFQLTDGRISRLDVGAL
ncbi:nuclear transport factor 2 family protein [Longispora urticae]